MASRGIDNRQGEIVTTRIPLDKKAELQEMAKREDRPVSYIARRAILRELEKAAA